MIILSYAESNDRWIRSSSSNYSTALNGANFVINEDDSGVYGQTYASSENVRYVRQYFVQFNYSIPAGQQPVGGHWAIRNNSTQGTNVNRNMEIYAFDWGGSVTSADWRTPSQINAMELEGNLLQTNNNSPNAWTFTGIRRIFGHMFETGNKRYVIVSNRNRTQSSPSQVEYNSFASSRTASAANRPHMVVGLNTVNAMSGIVAAQVQLSNGDSIVLERSTVDRVFQLLVIHRTAAGVPTTLWESYESTTLLENDNILGSHSYSMCRDNRDNFYIIDSTWSRTDRLNIHAFIKGSGNNWTQQGVKQVTLPAEDGQANVQAVASTWHDVGSGRIAIFAVTDWGRAVDGAQSSYALVDSSLLRDNASGNHVVQTGKTGDMGATARPSIVGRNNAVNATGTLFDAHTDSWLPRSGYLISGERSNLLGSTGAVSVGRYMVHSNALNFNTWSTAIMDNSGGFAVYDPDAKARIINVAPHQFVKITVDDRADWGLTLDHFSVDAQGTGFTKHATIQLDQESVPGFPTGGALASTSLWDAVYFPPDNSVWIYYFDDSDDRRLLRTSVSLSDDLALQNSVEVDDAVGSTGGEVHAIRVQRNRLVTDSVLVTASYETSGGDHLYDYIQDRINVPPTQPTLNAVNNFDSTLAQTFTWNFLDPNLVDSQTAYEVEIIRQSDSSVEYNSGKVSSTSSSHNLPSNTIDNNVDYYWRVRVWDVADAVSPWSAQRTFSTSNTGVVDITDPAVDNPPEVFTRDYLVQWSLAGASQEEFRVRVVRVNDNVEHTDTGWVTSSVQEYLILNLLSDVEYRIEVTTRQSLVESNTATRLVTTHYSTPEQPIVRLTVSNEVEFVLVSVENPEPRGDRPNPTLNEIYRRPLDSVEQFYKVGETSPNSSFRDYTVASGMRYEYKVRSGVEEGN